MKHSELTTPHDRPSRLWRPGALACALAVASGLALAQSGGFQTSGSVIGDEVMYSIGGGNAVSMSGAAGMRSLGVGVGWNSNLKIWLKRGRRFEIVTLFGSVLLPSTIA